MGRRCSIRDVKGIVWKRENFFFACIYEKKSPFPPREVFNDAALWRHEASQGGIRSACPSANMTYARTHTRVCAAIRHHTIRTWLNACDATCLTYLGKILPSRLLNKDDGVYVYQTIERYKKNWRTRKIEENFSYFYKYICI